MRCGTLWDWVKVPTLFPSVKSPELFLRRSQRRSFAWWFGLTSLLFVEVLLLTVRFDAATLKNEIAWGVWIFRGAATVFQIGLLGAMAALLLGGSELWREVRRGEFPEAFEDQSPRSTFYRWGVFLPLHLGALAVFVWLSLVMFEGDPATRLSHPGIWICAWGMFGTATLGLWALSCLSLQTWSGVLLHCWRPLLLGLLLGVIGWCSGVEASRFWDPLSQPTIHFVEALLRLSFADTVCDPVRREIGTSSFQVRITPGCSGYQGLGLMAVFLVVYLWLFRRRLRFPAALVLVPLGMGGIWLLNSVRIALLIAIGHWGWPEVALGGFHTQAGLFAFVALGLGLTVLTERSRWLSAIPEAQARRAPDAAVAYVCPFLALLCVSMVGGALSSGFDWLYPMRVVAVLVVVWFCRNSYGELTGGRSWTAPALGTVAFVVWVLLAHDDPVVDGALSNTLFAAPAGWVAAWLACRLIGHLFTVPLAEELAFRGFLIRQFTRRDFLAVAPDQFSWPALVASSLLFGGLHGRSWLAGTLAGMLFALAQRCHGKISDAVLAHATSNALLAGYVLVSGRWSLW
jgi:exosortase E/protease (VPEID-CTERM system)